MIGILQADMLVHGAESAGLAVEVETTHHKGHHYEAADYTAPDSISVRVRIAVPDAKNDLTISALWSKRLIKGGRGKLIGARKVTSHTSTDLKSGDLNSALHDLIAAHHRNA